MKNKKENTMEIQEVINNKDNKETQNKQGDAHPKIKFFGSIHQRFPLTIRGVFPSSVKTLILAGCTSKRTVVLLGIVSSTPEF